MVLPLDHVNFQNTHQLDKNSIQSNEISKKNRNLHRASFADGRAR